MSRARNGFTMLELLVAMAVGLPMLLAAMAFFRGQSESYSRGEQHMEVAQEAALVSRILYTEIKEIHAPLALDEKFDLWIAGEADGRPLPNHVVIEPSGKALRWWAYPIDRPGERVEKRLSLEGKSLAFSENGQARHVGRHLESLKFFPESGNAAAVRVTFDMALPSRPGVKPATASVDLLVGLEGELSVVR